VSSGKSAAGGAADSDSNAKDTSSSSSKRLSRKLRKAPTGSGVAEGELILLRLEGRILEEKEREREKEKRRNEQQQQQQPTKEDDEQQQQHHQQLAMAAVLSPKDLTRGGTLKRMMLAKAGGGSGIGSNLRDEMSGEKTTGSGICFNNNNNNNGTSAAANNSNNGGGGEVDAAPLERRQLNPLVLESQEDASASSLQKALSCVHEEDASLLPPLPSTHRRTAARMGTVSAAD
jgi:hypothetical protein